MRSLAIVLAFTAACGDETVPPGPSTCKGAIYDSCRDEHECTSANCRPFGSIQVCTQVCDIAPCPNDEMGNTVPCTNMLCQPTVANSCSLP